MSKKQKGIRITMMSGAEELASFKASDFNSADEINIALNLLVKVIVGTLVSASAHVISKVSNKANATEVIDSTISLLDVVVKHSKETIKDSIKDFAKHKDDKVSNKGSDA
jgi:hypothetical protein